MGIEDLEEVDGWDRFAQRGEVAQVGEEDGDGADFGADLAGSQDVARHLVVDVAAEHLGDARLLVDRLPGLGGHAPGVARRKCDEHRGEHGSVFSSTTNVPNSRLYKWRINSTHPTRRLGEE